MDVKRDYRQRKYTKASPGYDPLGPLKWLPGTWESKGRGWNMIALPFATEPPPNGFNYRVLMNQYNETLRFNFIDEDVPNRGITENVPGASDTDQFLVTLDYQQSIDQVVAADSPESEKEGPRGADIHHEPGLWLHMVNERTDKLDIARLATIPHGNSALALGRADYKKGKPEIPDLNGLPIGVGQDLDGNRYLAPYKHFEDNRFFGDLPPNPNPGSGEFPGFFPTNMNAILQFAVDTLPPAVNTTILHVDTKLQKAGIVNIPFIEREADASEMTSTFWIQELADKDEKGNPKLRLQYSQTVMLDFFEVPGGGGELIRWPHISINTLDKVSDEVLPVA
ncbi:MAG: heme-binding protein [Pseudomonadota bacterium]